MNCDLNPPPREARRTLLPRFIRAMGRRGFPFTKIRHADGVVLKAAACLMVFPLLWTPAQAQQLARIPQTTTVRIPVATPPPFEVLADYGSGNALAEKLRNAPAKLYNFDRASLRDVLRFMADDAGIPFVALQESSAAENTLVTFTLRASPFRALETIARANGIQLFFENGIWFMRPINEQELIARIYKLKFNPQDNITYTGAQAPAGGAAASDNGGVSSLDLTLQQPTDVFKVEAPATVEQIKKLLGIPTSGISANMAPETSVGNFGQLQVPKALNPAGSRFSAEGVPKGDQGAQVIYNDDSSTLYVIATRQQHQWVEGFLSAADRPQALIGIEIKFLETNKDPTKELGINWAGTLEGGYSVTAAASAKAAGSLDSKTASETLGRVFDGTGYGAYQATVNGVSSSVNSSFNGGGTGSQIIFDGNGLVKLADPISKTTTAETTGFTGGYTATLTPDDVSVALQAFIRDRDSTVVQYPRVLTLNNREVAIRSVVNQPLVASSSSVDSAGGTGINSAGVSYLPIGTIINVLPKTMPDGSVMLNVAITISRIVSFQTLNVGFGPQPYPVPASRVYNAALQVDSGFTLAVSGIDEATDTRDNTGVPFLKDIPGVGELFKSKSRSQRKRSLIIFITPTVITNRVQSNGISESPNSVLPVRPGEPTPPAFTPTGRLVGGQASIDEAISWLQRQVDFFRQIVDESRADKDSIKQLKSVINTAEMLLEEIQRMEDESPDRMAALIKKEEQTLTVREELKKVLGKSQKNLTEF